MTMFRMYMMKTLTGIEVAEMHQLLKAALARVHNRSVRSLRRGRLPRSPPSHTEDLCNTLAVCIGR